MNTITHELYRLVPWLSATVIGGAASLSGVAKHLKKTKAMSETSDVESTKHLEAPFLQAITTHQGIIQKICRTYSNNRADEQDLHQEIICQLWKFYPSYRAESQFSTWMYSVALRTAILPFRKEKINIEYRGVVPETYSSPKDHSIDDEMFKLFRRLDRIDRAVLLLLMEDFSVKEIGAVLELKKGATDMRIKRMRAEVREH